MSRIDAARLADIVEAVEAIDCHLGRGDLSDGLAYDAVRARPIESGEAVKSIRAGLLETEPDIPWKAIARMRDHLTHRYFDTDHAIVHDVLDNELTPLPEAVCRIQAQVTLTKRDGNDGPRDPRSALPGRVRRTGATHPWAPTGRWDGQPTLHNACRS